MQTNRNTIIVKKLRIIKYIKTQSMKPNTTPKLLIDLPEKVFQFRDLFFKPKHRILLLVVFLFCGFTVSAQSSSIKEVKSFLSDLKQKDQTARSRSSSSSDQNLEHLLYKLQPSVYFYSGTAKTYGENPNNLFTNISSLRGIANANFSKNNIEIVTIKIDKPSDLNTTIDLSQFQSFEKLKFIYILSNVPTTEQGISRLISNNNDTYGLFYQIQVSE
jgi:hypothetical protein